MSYKDDEDVLDIGSDDAVVNDPDLLDEGLLDDDGDDLISDDIVDEDEDDDDLGLLSDDLY